MAAYHARVDNNCIAGTPDTPRTPAAAAAARHVVMNTPSMHNFAASAIQPLADVTDAIGRHGDASDEPSEDRSLLTRHSTTGVNR